MKKRMNIARMILSIGLLFIIVALGTATSLIMQYDSQTILQVLVQWYIYVMALSLSSIGLALFGYGLGWLTLLKKYDKLHCEGDEE